MRFRGSSIPFAEEEEARRRQEDEQGEGTGVFSHGGLSEAPPASGSQPLRRSRTGARATLQREVPCG